MKTKIVTIIFAGFIAFGLYAQQEVHYTQYMYNTMLLNPGYTGTKGRLEASLVHRSQWVGLNGAPTTQSLTVHARTGKFLGLGLGVIHDQLGPTTETALNANIAARLKISKQIWASLGVNGGADFMSVDWSKGNYHDVTDQAYSENFRNRVRPLVGAGLFVYTQNWYAGLSSPNFIKNDSYTGLEEAQINKQMHFYFMAGYVFNLSDNLKFKPALMSKFVKGANVSVDLSANFLIKDVFTIGVAYRYNDAASILAGLQLKQRYFIGYSYDYSVSKLRNYNNGSHEIILRYNLPDKDVKARSPRFF